MRRVASRAADARAVRKARRKSAGTLKRALFRPLLARRGAARAEGGCAADARPARSRADVLSFPSVPEWPRANRALGLAALERESALLRIFSALKVLR